ncbi:hypothetical protein [Sphingobium nicotianae]|uniref:Uncharacterized protein n=1 Tax=Sphingobium nicotianae TaxID=2782607 RepID=A0A9X1DB61_9SPHN|nr:hypothetical protein [Sphingobium nicotianae]MBT2186714.1 hypothetical protein [Sphingobium nicotianae]
MIRAALLGGVLLCALAAPALADPASPAARARQFAKLPYWDGLWLTENDQTTIGGLSEVQEAAKATGEKPKVHPMKLIAPFAPWNEEGKRRLAEVRKTQGNRKADGWGYPMMMNGAAPIEFLITPEETLIINGYRDVRHIYTDGRKHPAPDDRWPTVWGDSVGHWEGDTLVVDTISVKNPNVYFHGGPPLSDDADYAERIRMVGKDRIEVEMVITDPTTLTGPWKSQLAFVRATGFDRMIHMEYDNDRTVFDGDNNTIAPPRDEQPAQH